MSIVFEIQDGILLSVNGEESEVAIPYGVNTIGKDVFKGKSWIEKVTLPETVRIINENAFKGCRKLSSINFPSGLTEIGDFAFHRCHALTSAILPDTLTKLGAGAFLYCDNIKCVSIAGVLKLKRQTFANDTMLSHIILNSNIDCSNFSDDIFTGCVKINKITISGGDSFNIPNLISAITSDNSVSPIVKAVAKGVYQSMQLEDGKLFKFFVNLKNFELPEGIKSIEKSCFYNKKGIVSITFPESLDCIKANAFGNCINLEEITIQNKDIVIDEKAFKGCNNLKRVHYGKSFSLENIITEAGLPDTVRKIGEQILSDFYISGKTLMQYYGNEERVTVPNGIRVIDEGAFENNCKLDRVILPDTIEEIREDAFKNCTSMQTIMLSQNLRSIGKSAFENCRKLIRVSLPEKVKIIEESAFKRCSVLEQFDISDSSLKIDNMAFYGCRKLKSLNISENTLINGNLTFYNSGIDYTYSETKRNQVYGENDIIPYKFCKDSSITKLTVTDACVIGKYAFSACKNLTELIIDSPDCIIERSAFEKCDNLRSVKLNVKEIQKGAFSFCEKLDDLQIDGVNTIGDQAFSGCTSLCNIKLSHTVTQLGIRCFEECTALRKFDFSTIEIIGERAFSRCEGLSDIDLPSFVIGRRAFEDCCNLKRISISSDIILKSGAFLSCTKVNEVTVNKQRFYISKFSESINCLDNRLPELVQEVIASIFSCFKISEEFEIIKYIGNSSSVRIPDGINSIGDEVFKECIRLKDLVIPENIKNIGKLCFTGTSWLADLQRKNKITVVNDLLIDGAKCGRYIEIPAEVKKICSWAFAGNCQLTEVKFLGSRTAVSEYAFRNCINLKKITDSEGNVYQFNNISVRQDTSLPEVVRKIFNECINCFKTDENGVLVESTGNIKDLVFPDGITAIADEVYKDCNLLEKITLSPDTLSIGKGAFENSKWLKKIKNLVGLRTIESMAFSGCQSLETIELSDNLRIIGKRCFEHCCNLREIYIPEGVTEIPERTFFRCKSLKKVILPSTLKRIGTEAFAFCDSLEEISVPPTIEKIGERAFAWCGKLNNNQISPDTSAGL